jgi:23S rRNA (cytosine1962-C5)-methyltransferase
MDQYTLIDSGNGRKLEQFGPIRISRPSAQAAWECKLPQNEWDQAEGIFSRENENKWLRKPQVPDPWIVRVAGIHFKLLPTDFGHLGIFPEQEIFWNWIQTKVANALKTRTEVHVLNLFAYSGGITLAAAKAGAHVCHLDASKGMVSWAKENAQINKLDKAPIRWIVDDVTKFLKREIKRGRYYDAIVLDPPTFGRGSQGELFKIEEDLLPMLHLCKQLLSNKPLFFLLSCHTPGYTPLVLQHVLAQLTASIKGTIDAGEMALRGSADVFSLPSGAYARWSDE